VLGEEDLSAVRRRRQRLGSLLKERKKPRGLVLQDRKEKILMSKEFHLCDGETVSAEN